jgi:hypothetical protein
VKRTETRRASGWHGSPDAGGRRLSPGAAEAGAAEGRRDRFSGCMVLLRAGRILLSAWGRPAGALGRVGPGNRPRWASGRGGTDRRTLAGGGCRPALRRDVATGSRVVWRCCGRDAFCCRGGSGRRVPRGGWGRGNGPRWARGRGGTVCRTLAGGGCRPALGRPALGRPALGRYVAAGSRVVRRCCGRDAFCCRGGGGRRVPRGGWGRGNGPRWARGRDGVVGQALAQPAGGAGASARWVGSRFVENGGRAGGCGRGRSA